MSGTVTETYTPPKQYYLSLSPSNGADILNNKPPEVVDIALSHLQRKFGVKLIEWQALVHRRMKVPILLRDYSYLVPDTQVSQVSKALSHLGLPLEDPSTHVLSTSGDFDSRGFYHRITRHTSPFLLQYIVIYPQSFATISDAELEEAIPSHILSSRCSKVFVPSAPAIYASIMRMILNYPQHSPTMYQLQSDLSELIGYHLLGLARGYVGEDEEDEWEVDRRISEAVSLVHSWSLDGTWREGEDWMGDVLAEVVKTGHIEYLPCKPKES